MGAGRKREFDKQAALEKAMHTFWLKGFAGASLSDLTASMGINKPSLYAAFGNKENLFVAATDYYVDHYASQHVHLLDDDSKPLRERLNNYLTSVMTMQCAPDKPAGCMISLCASEAAANDMPDEAIEAVHKVQSFTEDRLKHFFSKEIEHGNLPAGTDADTATLYIITLIHGTAAMARSGKPLREILSVIEPALDSMVPKAVVS